MPTASQAQVALRSSDGPLQNAFKSYRARKLNQIAREENGKKPAERTQEFRDELRKTFLETCLSYQGVPYHKRYHKDPNSPHHNAPLYLDCCGLVRRAARDLEEDFGFHIGRYNQSYQMDTLPIILTKEEMKPGDLVFVESPWYDKSRKPQTGDIQHVEIWMGDGDKTVGARLANGVVKVFDSYQYQSKKYGPNKYHFRSIETWLNGVCKSHNPKKAWPNSGRQVAKNAKSIFAKGAK